MIPTLPQHWQLARLGDVCQLNPRDPVPRDTTGSVSFVPMSAIDEQSGEITAPEERDISEVVRGYTSFGEGDVLFAKITPCMENGKAAIAHNLIGGRGFGSTEFHVLRPGPFVLAEWLFHFVRRDAFRRQAARNFTGTAGQQRVPTAFLQFTKIPVPPLSEQRRIVQALEEADSIRQLHSAAETNLRGMISSLLGSLFGDLSENERGYEVVKIGSLLEEQPNYGTMTPATEDASGAMCIRVGDIRDNELDLSGVKYVSRADIDKRRHSIRTGDMLLVRAIGSIDHLGKSFIVPPELDGHAFDSHLMRIRTDKSRLLPEFLHAFLAAPQGRSLFLKHTRQSAVQVNINTGEFCSIPLSVPPIGEQKAFIEHVNCVNGIRTDLVCASNTLRHLGSSLANMAFSGDLTKTWRTAHSPQLHTEAAARDAVLKSTGVSISDTLVITDTITAEIDRRRRDLSREQGKLFDSIQASWKPDDPETWVFTHETLAESLDSPLNGSADAIRRHLEVFAARGLIIPMSREVELSDGTTEWRVAYRRPHAKSDDGPPDDAIRKQELASLANQIKELPK